MMASSTSPPTNLQIPQMKYDVFLSFRGEDTRNNFTSHLHAALSRKQIKAFIDNQLRRGDEISQSLFEAIEASQISVVIFSKDYPSSSWCLDELVKILECKNKYGQLIIPIFYHIDPSNVRHQTGAFGDAFVKLFQERFQEKLQRWRLALKEAANISGYHSHGTTSESELIEEIANDILKKLNDMFPVQNDDKDQLVGVDLKIKEIQSILNTHSKDVYTLGIWGIGGIGKTTIANVIFNKICGHFEGYCFISNIRAEEEKSRGLNHLQQELLSTLLVDENVKIHISNIGYNFESKRLSRKKVLIVLDDVTHFNQIEFLIGGFKFAIGSQIIITTRDKHLLNICKVDYIYEVKKLAHHDALKLFSRHAFRKNSLDVDYKELIDKVIEYANGVPLALKVLGCFLFSRSKEEWGSAINKLKRMPNLDIQKVLKLSYDGLDHEEKNIFLDIACFFKDENQDFVIKFLDACGISGLIGIRVLVDKSLITISNYNKISIHGLLEEMGKEIVRQESINDPEKRSRLWHHEDIYEVLTYNKGTKAIEGISLDMSKVKEIILDSRTFTKMPKLKFLKLYGENKFKVSKFRGLGFTKIRYLQWNGYPLKSLPSNINPEHLVSLQIPGSNIKRLWKGVQCLRNLKRMYLAGSKQLVEIPDLSLAQNLETLILENCTSLIEIHSSIQLLNKLQSLNLSGCSNLRRSPDIRSCNLEALNLRGTAIEELPSSMESLSRLIRLNLSNCKKLESLPSSLCNLKSLECLDLFGCSNLQRLPDQIGKLNALTRLRALGTAISEAPPSITCLKKLVELDFRVHEEMGLLYIYGSHSQSFPGLFDSGIKELPENLGHLSSLLFLNLDGNDFVSIPESIIHLPKLQRLCLSHCKRLQSLPKLPCSLAYLAADHCTSLEALSGLTTLFTPKSWNSQEFWLGNCLKLDPDELNQIGKDALKKIRSIFTAWYNGVRDKGHRQVRHGEIFYPGSEIPEWIGYQSSGSSITLELPPGCFNNNFLGFTLCAIIACQDHRHLNDDYFAVMCESKLRTKDGHWHIPSISPLTIGKIYYVGSDHVLLGYDFRIYVGGAFGDYYEHSEAFFQFYIEYGSLENFEGIRLECCQVKKCGIHFFDNQDLGESSQNCKVVHEVRGVEPNPKRLKYSTSPSQD